MSRFLDTNELFYTRFGQDQIKLQNVRIYELSLIYPSLMHDRIDFERLFLLKFVALKCYQCKAPCDFPSSTHVCQVSEEGGCVTEKFSTGYLLFYLS